MLRCYYLSKFVGLQYIELNCTRLTGEFAFLGFVMVHMRERKRYNNNIFMDDLEYFRHNRRFNILLGTRCALHKTTKKLQRCHKHPIVKLDYLILYSFKSGFVFGIEQHETKQIKSFDKCCCKPKHNLCPIFCNCAVYVWFYCLYCLIITVVLYKICLSSSVINSHPLVYFPLFTRVFSSECFFLLIIKKSQVF